MKKKGLKQKIAILLAAFMMVTVIPVDNVYASQQESVFDEAGTQNEITTVESTEASENETSETVEETETVETEEVAESTETTKTEEVTESTEEISDTEIIEETEETEETETTEEEETKEFLINYMVMEKANVKLSETQNIVVGLGDASSDIQAARLFYRNETNGVSYHVDAAQIMDDAVSFKISFNNENEKGEYTLEKISYAVDGAEYTEYFAEAGIQAKFGVEAEVESEPDAVVVDENAVNADNEVQMDVVTFDENGNQVSEESIESAIENAEADIPAVMSIDDEMSSRAAKNLTVVLDPGHDNTHIGARANNLQEQTLNLKIAMYCKEELEKYSGVTVYLTRSANGSCPYPGTSSGDCNLNRVNYAKSVGADVYVSIHNNSSSYLSAQGAMVFYPNKNYNPTVSQAGQGLARSIENKLVALGLYNRGITIKDAKDDKYPDGSVADYYGVIRNSKLVGIPAIIIEHAFVTNSNDVNNYLNSDEKLKKLGVADATGIAEYYGLTKGLKLNYTKMSSTGYAVGSNAVLTYSVNDNADVTVDVYNSDNSYLMNVVSNQFVGKGEHQVSWNLKRPDGKYVFSGNYRFTITVSNNRGEKDVEHQYFSVTGNDPFNYKWTKLSNTSYEIGKQAELYYAVNRDAKVTVDIYDGNDKYLMNLFADKSVGTNDQVARWDLKDRSGTYVTSGKYRMTITAVDDRGYKIVSHQYFNVTGNDLIDFKWVLLSDTNYKVGDTAQLYYAVNRNATVNVDLYDGNDRYVQNIIKDKTVGTNDQVARWDLKTAGKYVSTGRFRFTITAKTDDGRKVTQHKYFNVTGKDPLDFKWTTLSKDSYAIGENAELYYAVNYESTIRVDVYDGNDNFLKTLEPGKKVGTNDQVIRWDLKNNAGNYVRSGNYRFTIKATDADGSVKTVHKYFKVTGNDGITFRWANLTATSYTVGNTVDLYYAVSESAKVTIEVYDGNNNYLETLENQKDIKTNDQVVHWDMKKSNGSYVNTGTYRITLIATASDGMKTVVHKYFQVEGRKPVEYKWTNLDKNIYIQGTDTVASLYYAVNRDATVKVDIYYENNTYMKTLQKSKPVGTNDQVVTWNFEDADGKFVDSGIYRFTITAIDTDGNKVTVHKYFKVQSLYGIMGNSNTSVKKMMAYFNANQSYPEFYRNTDAPTLEQYCQIYMEECSIENVRVEVAFSQAMKETGFLKFGGKVKIEQYNFAGIGAVDSGKTAPASFSSVREGIRAQIQHLKAYASTEPLKNSCVDPRFSLVKRGTAPYVEWLGIQENPNHVGWATAKNYGYSIKNDYMRKLISY